MERLAEAVAAIALLAVMLGPLKSLWQGVQGTALRMAWPWCAVAWGTWGAALVVRITGVGEAGLLHALWYVAAIATLAPLVAILGGRWPTSRVWSLFVVLPLLLVLLWPVVAVIVGLARWDRFELEAPMLLGSLLVSVMGWGNYIGSRWTMPALAGLVGQIALLISLTPEIAADSLSPESCSLLLCGILCAGSLWVWYWGRQSSQYLAYEESAWIEFQQLFGIVWSRRIQDRVNEVAREKGWKVRLGSRGWLDGNGQSVSLSGVETGEGLEPRGFLEWLLQKFVEPGWIAAHQPPEQ